MLYYSAVSVAQFIQYDCCAAALDPLQVHIAVPFPDGKLVYDYVLDSTKLKWIPWLDRLESKALDTDDEYSSIIVPTMDTLRYTHLLDVLVQHKHHCLLVGPTGTGKTVSTCFGALHV